MNRSRTTTPDEVERLNRRRRERLEARIEFRPKAPAAMASSGFKSIIHEISAPPLTRTKRAATTAISGGLVIATTTSKGGKNASRTIRASKNEVKSIARRQSADFPSAVEGTRKMLRLCKDSLAEKR
jgi:hypothetical protein